MHLGYNCVYLPNKYNYQKVDGVAHFKDYFRISSNDMTNDIHLGLSDGYIGHEHDRWEIVIGGRKASEHVIRDRMQGPLLARVSSSQAKFNQLRNDFILQCTDGKIAVYESDSGRKGILIMEFNDQRIKKSKLNTLAVSGGWGSSGDIHFRGYPDNFSELKGKSHF